MATKKAKNDAPALKEVSRKEIEGIIIITYEDGSVKIIPNPIVLTKEQAEEVFGTPEEEEEEDEDEEEPEEEEDDDEEEEDDDDSDDDEEEEDDDDEEEEITPEALAGMDFEELEDVCDDKDLDTDPDDYEEDDVEKLRKAIAKELGISLPAKKAKGKKGKK